ncbi:MAG: hypothetical protein KW802_03485 [Candidatus Doudnabacteria bacterium]|nr:hypothetical protein [Candidatus Doudnabacteria bacterium]
MKNLKIFAILPLLVFWFGFFGVNKAEAAQTCTGQWPGPTMQLKIWLNNSSGALLADINVGDPGGSGTTNYNGSFSVPEGSRIYFEGRATAYENNSPSTINYPVGNTMSFQEGPFSVLRANTSDQIYSPSSFRWTIDETYCGGAIDPSWREGHGEISFGISTTAPITTQTINVSSNVNTSWSILGPNSKSGSGTSATYSSTTETVSAGSYTITAQTIPGMTLTYVSPQTQSLSAGGTINFTLNYNTGSSSPPGPFSIITGNPCFGWPNPGIEISITGSSGASTYDLYRSVNNAGLVFYVGGFTFASLDSYSDTNISGGNTYEYRVRAINSAGYIDSSNTTGPIPVNSTNCGGSPPPPPPPPPPGPGCSGNCAEYTSQSVPLTMTAGVPTPVTITFRNVGTTTWTCCNPASPPGDIDSADGYKLGSQSAQDNITWGYARVKVPNVVAPGDYAVFSFNAIPPATAGTYNFQWRMVQEYVQWFVNTSPTTPLLSINVVADDPPWLSLETPANGSSVSGTANVSGWAVDNITDAEGPITSFAVILDSVTLLNSTSYGNTLRNDVCTAYPGRFGCPNVGFSYPWNTTTLANGAHVITVRVGDQGGHYTESSVNVTVNNQTPLAAPTNITVSNPSCALMTITWTDNSNNENYFEVWGGLSATAVTDLVATNLYAPNGIAGTGGTGTYSYSPPVNQTYYYYVKVVRTGPPSQSANSAVASGFNRPCLPDLSNSTKSIYQVNGSAYTSSTTIKTGDTVTFRIILNNTGSANATIVRICDTPSANFNTLRALTVTGTGAAGGTAGNLSRNTANCPGTNTYELNVSGTKTNSGSWTITFSSTFTSTGGGGFEVCSNTAAIRYTDSEGTKTQNTRLASLLCNKTGNGTPDFNE